MASHRSLPLLLLLVLAICASLCQADESCGSIYDGLTNGKFDLAFQSSTSTIAANWFDFPSDILKFEYAVISDSQASRIPKNQCFGSFRLIPDVLSWQSAKKQNSFLNSNVQLQVDTKYYVLLRITFRSGKISFIASDGVFVLPADILSSVSVAEDDHQATIQAKHAVSSSNSKRDVSSTSTASLCAIDLANQCRQQTSGSVADLLTEIYGPPVFNANPIFTQEPLPTYAQLYQSTYYYHQNNDGAWIAGILISAMFLIFLLIFLLALCVLVLLPKNDGDRQPDRSKPPKPRDDDDYAGVVLAGTPDEIKDYGGRASVGVGDSSSAYRIEFPDTNIRRLSITHQDSPDLESVNEAKSPRRKHPILNSTSSSFRDYRSEV